MERALVLVDGEHYPPVVRAALAAAARDDRIVAALLLGGTEKLRGEPDYGVPLEHAGRDAAGAMVAAVAKHAATRVVDLSDEPVLSERDRFRLINRALAAGLSYRGADFEFVMVNGAPGWVLSRSGAPFAVTTIETEGDKVRKVFATLNPDKLAHVRAPQGASS